MAEADRGSGRRVARCARPIHSGVRRSDAAAEARMPLHDGIAYGRGKFGFVDVSASGKGKHVWSPTTPKPDLKYAAPGGGTCSTADGLRRKSPRRFPSR